eukprot:804925-Rhodomonas_salina.1
MLRPSRPWVYALCAALLFGMTVDSLAFDANIGIMVPMRWGGPDAKLEPWAVRYAASAAMAAYHVNHRVTSLVPKARELLPANFKL